MRRFTHWTLGLYLLRVIGLLVVAATVGVSRDSFFDIAGDDRCQCFAAQTIVPVSGRKRGRKRKSGESGLPDPETLLDMAVQYLAIQHKYWPQLANTEYLPANTQKAAAKMAEQWKERYINDCHRQIVRVAKDLFKEIAATYLRYSSENSSTTSLVQQMRVTLDRAHQNGHFIPWEYVFADAAMSATTPNRPGYQLAKKILSSSEHDVTVLYVAEISRANRYSIESLKLGALIMHRRKRLIGVSDGFDSDHAMSKVVLAIFSALQEFYVDMLRSNVKRGRKEAFLRKRHLRKRSLGYKLVPSLDARGESVYSDDGRPQFDFVVDKGAACWVILAYELFIDKLWTLSAIAKHFNELGVGGMAWDVAPVRQLLARELHVGIEIDGKTCREFNPETESFELIHQPRNLWKVRRASHLRLVPYRRWKAAQKRLAEIAEAYAPSSVKKAARRLKVHKTRLVRPYCPCCDIPLYLGKSGKYPSYVCFNGRARKNGCTFTNHKSVRIVETCVLNYVLRHVLTEARFKELVEKANLYLQQEQAKPVPDLRPKMAELDGITRKLNRWKVAMEEDTAGKVKTIVAEIAKYERQAAELRREISSAQRTVRDVQPIDPNAVIELLAGATALLNGARDKKGTEHVVAQAAVLLEKITGKVVVREALGTAKRGNPWMAYFTVDLIPVVLELSRAAKCPTSCSLDLLKSRSWTMAIECEVAVEPPYKYVEIAPEVKRLYEEGATIEALAAIYKADSDYMKEVLKHAQTGEKPAWGPVKTSPSGKPSANSSKTHGEPKHKRLASLVAKLRDQDRLTWPRVLERVFELTGERISDSVAKRAWDEVHPEAIAAAVGGGGDIDRGMYRFFLSLDKHRQIEDMIKSGASNDAITSAVGCGERTVTRARKRLKSGA